MARLPCASKHSKRLVQSPKNTDQSHTAATYFGEPDPKPKTYTEDFKRDVREVATNASATSASQTHRPNSNHQPRCSAGSWPYPKAWHTSLSTPELVYYT